MSFQRRLYLSYVVIFLLFLALLFPFASIVVRHIVKNGLVKRTDEMIDVVTTAANGGGPSEANMVRALHEREAYLFYRITLINSKGEILYDSHGKVETKPDYPAIFLQNHPVVQSALEKGIAFQEGYSHVLKMHLAYVAKSFILNGQTYVMRIAYPVDEMERLQRDFEIGFFIIGVVLLLLFVLATSLITYRLTAPIQTIVRAIKPYQEGKTEHLPEVKLWSKRKKHSEFQTLVDTLNSLTSKIEDQINTLKAERNEKEAVLESLVEGVIAVNAEMLITDVNHTALEMLQMGRGELIGQDFMVTDQKEFYDLLLNCQQEGKILTSTRQLSLERKRIYLDVIAVPKEIESGAVLILQDKSTHYKVLEMRKDFIANASHELKTPITIVRGFAEALHDHPDIGREMTQQITEKITRNCERMERLVKNLLRLADIENLPRGNLQKCKIGDLVESCRQMVLSVYSSAEIRIHKPVQEELTLLADPDLLELAVMNLLDNGAKYSTPPAQIDVTIATTPKRDEIMITIADKGMGIPQEDLEQIFQRFYTVNKAHSRRLGGSGLGLSIVQTIIEKHFGKISVQSKLGKGTTFTITLPVDLERFH